MQAARAQASRTKAGAAGPASSAGRLVLRRKCERCGTEEPPRPLLDPGIGSLTSSGRPGCPACAAAGASSWLRRAPASAASSLTIEPADSAAEHEADRIADRVLDGPAPAAAWRVQRDAASPGGTALAAPASVDRALAAPGRPLAPALRKDMEARFGHDFAQVRVHTDGLAAQSARDVDAQAYTVGHDVVFAAGRYRPGSAEGRRLIAHELTHVVQQGGGLARTLQRQPANCDALLLTPQNAGTVSGIAVHQAILAHFMTAVPGARRVSIPGASAAPLRTQGLCGEDASMIKPQIGRSGPGSGRGSAQLGLGSPDLARSTLNGALEIAEIKPASVLCLVDGAAQLDNYLVQGNAPDAPAQTWRTTQAINAVIPMLPSTYLPPPLFVGGCPVQTAWCSPGLMVYNIECAEPPPIPVPQEQEQEQEQESPAQDEPALRLPHGPVWDLVYGLIIVLGTLAIIGTVVGKLGALLGMLARALGLTLGLLAGGVATAGAATTGSPRPGGKPVPTPGPSGPATGPTAPPRDRTTTPGSRKSPGSATTPAAPAKAAGPTVQIDLIEGLNLDTLSPGMIFPLMLSDMKSRHDVAIMEVTGVKKERDRTTIDLQALQEHADAAPGQARPTVLMGRRYAVTHPHRGSEPPGLVGEVVKPGADPAWWWTYLDNLAKQLDASGRKVEADGVRQEIRRQQDLQRKAGRK
ncbi:MAG: DUF4157 domain-containing protein [Proteobacteria bacterium]|nr:DUF4157 domain-containing protein [Pseudomonadota bacterium]